MQKRYLHVRFTANGELEWQVCYSASPVTVGALQMLSGFPPILMMRLSEQVRFLSAGIIVAVNDPLL
ncbi:hypothetical protein L6164_027485 [Bauhinia variegata]|uniref:Uncharacterized protein n=1 Tax=Bauhinia variegata TaxID=167791 RepID=A0ACB9LTC0_BAUVA|nr:hypothetical protein L6164_027485 [Bauhinia variegata]